MAASRPATLRLQTAAACAAILYITLFWQLGAHSFWDPDEAHYAQTTREMLDRGDWLAPFYNGQPFFDKPIFFYWLQGMAMRLTGPAEAAARLPGAVAGVLLVCFTGWIGVRLAGSAVGWLAALLLAANPGLFGLARYAILDAPFTLFLFGGVSMLTLAAGVSQQPAEEPLRARYEWLGYLSIAMAVCIKGPVALAMCAIVLAIASIASAEARRRLFALHWIRGVLLIVALATPWFVYMFVRFRQAFVDVYFLNENLRLFGEPLYGNQPGWWFYLRILLVGFLPWTGLILGRAWDQLRDRRGGRGGDLADTLLWSWVGGVTLFFSVSQFKLDHYIFPTAPALCIIAARAWLAVRDGEAGTGARAGAAAIGPILVAAGGVVAYLAVFTLALPAAFLGVPALILGLGLGAIWQERRREARVPVFAVAALLALYAGVVVYVLPALEQGKVIPDIARYVIRHATAEDRIGTFRLNRWNPAFRFYVERPVTMFNGDDEAARFFADTSPFYVVMTSDLFEILQTAGVPFEEVYRREGVWATSGRLLWREKGQPTVFVVAKSKARHADGGGAGSPGL
jgi:4-amino-4-deoxy-L-arabinose transferase-like glycosyltransferase